MLWRDIAGAWLLNKKDLVDLIWCLVETNIIPETLVNNSTLQSDFADANHAGNIKRNFCA